mgnify:CR=1 FL=1
MLNPNVQFDIFGGHKKVLEQNEQCLVIFKTKPKAWQMQLK